MEKQQEHLDFFSLRQKAEQKLKVRRSSVGRNLNTDEDELRIMQLELEMQNEELQASYLSLEAEKVKFTSFFDLAPVAYFILNPLGIVQEINETGYRLLKLKRADVTHKRLLNFIWPEDHEIYHQFLYRLQSTLTKHQCELRMVQPNGQVVYCTVQGAAVNTTKTTIKYYLTFIDISDSRKAGQQLLEAKNRLEITLKASGAGAWSYDIEKNFFYLDEFCYSMLNLKPWDFAGDHQGFINLVHKSHRQNVERKLKNTIFLGEELDLEFRMKKSSTDDAYINIRGQIIDTMDGRKLAGILIDVTDKINLQKQTEKLKTEQQKQLLKAIFKAQESERKNLSEALHDSVCQLLYGIKLNLQALLGKEKISAPFKNISALIDQSIKETREISYKLTPSVLADFGFKAGIEELAQRLNTSKFMVLTKVSTETSKLPADLQLSLFRMVQELINNSIKHSEAKTAKIEVTMKADEVRITVSDDGKGMNSEVNISDLSGSGIRGIKNRVYLLNGKLWIETAESKGFKTNIIFNIQEALGSLRKE